MDRWRTDRRLQRAASSNWFRNQLQNSQARVPPTGRGTTSKTPGARCDWPQGTSVGARRVSSRSKDPFMSCASHVTRPRHRPPRELPGLERRRRWSHRTRARAQAACHRPSRRRWAEPRPREVASRLRGARGGRPAGAARRGRGPTPAVANYASFKRLATVGVRTACYLAPSSWEWCDWEVTHDRKRVDIDRQTRALGALACRALAGTRSLVEGARGRSLVTCEEPARW